MRRSESTFIATAGVGSLALLLAAATPVAANVADENDAQVVVLSDEAAPGDVRLTDSAFGRARVILVGDDAKGAKDANDFHFADAHAHAITTDDAHSIQVRIVNGEATVTVDGKELPESRIVHKDGAIVVLDEGGKEIRTIQVGPLGGDRTFGLFAGEGGDAVWFGDARENLMLPAPKVMLGVQLDTPSKALERHLRLEPGATTLITALYKGLPADTAGLAEYDVITSIDGRRPADPATLRQTLADLEPGATLALGIISEGSPRTVRVKLEAYDRDAMRSAEVIGDVRGTALFGPNFFGRRLDDAGAQSLFELDFGNVEDLNRFFLDDSNRLYEMPKGRMRLELKGEPGGEGEVTQEVEVELDSRLSTLDRRLAALEEMLDALLKEAKRDRR